MTKLVFANNFYYIRGGAERVFFDEMEMLASLGYEVAPFSRHFEKNLSSVYSKYFPSPIEYENVSLGKKIVASFRLIYSLESRRNFSMLLDSFNPDVIHAHNIYGRLTTSIIDAAKGKFLPVVMTLHDFKLICPSYLMLSKGNICERCMGSKFYYCTLERCHKGDLSASAVYTIETCFNALLKKYDNVKFFICPSKFFVKKHAEAGIPEEKLIYIPNFIRTDHLNTGYTPGDYILFAGRLSREKGILTLLKAVKGLDIPLRIAGDGPMRDECAAYVKDNNIDNVVFEGYKTGDDLKRLFSGSAFLVIPSEWYENAPMTVLEAFAHGKPVIGSDIGGIPEMAIEGETGLLFKPGDHGELREKIKYLLANPTIITAMGKRARKKVESEYNPGTHCKKLIEVYEKACS